MTHLTEARPDRRELLETDMIIVMKADASPEQIVKVAEQVETLGLKPHVIEGAERTVVAVVGAEKDATVSAMETVPGRLVPSRGA